MTDPVADMIIRIKNALLARHTEVEIPHSKLKESIGRILEKQGYVGEMEIKQDGPQPTMLIKLKYKNKAPVITDVRRLSKPGRRVYATAKKIPKTLGGYGITIVSTSHGVFTDQEARQQNVGGELLCQIW